VMENAVKAQANLKGRAEMMCAKALGVGCGCPKVGRCRFTVSNPS